MAEKMLIHIGRGDERQTYTFDYHRLLNVEAMAMERVTEWPLQELVQRAGKVSLTALTAIVWILRRRNEPGLQFEDVVFPFADLETEFIYDDEEKVGPKEPAGSETSGETEPS